MLALLLVALAVLLLSGRASDMIAPTPYAGTTPADFVAWLGPIARDSQRRTGIPASVVIAQAAVESSWGKSLLLRRTGNAFGVKAFASWPGRVISATTYEEVGGVKVKHEGTWEIYPTRAAALEAGADPVTLFRVYPSTIESIRDHARVLYNGLYDDAMRYRHDGIAFARAIAPVYATDSAYATLLVDVIRGRNLTTWDLPPDQWALDPGVVPPEYRA